MSIYCLRHFAKLGFGIAFQDTPPPVSTRARETERDKTAPLEKAALFPPLVSWFGCVRIVELPPPSPALCYLLCLISNFVVAIQLQQERNPFRPTPALSLSLSLTLFPPSTRSLALVMAQKKRVAASLCPAQQPPPCPAAPVTPLAPPSSSCSILQPLLKRTPRVPLFLSRNGTVGWLCGDILVYISVTIQDDKKAEGT